MLDSFQPSFDAKNKRVVEEDPEPFIVDVPRVPKAKGTDVSGFGTPVISAPGRPEVEDEDLPFKTPLTAICWETKPKEVSLKTKGAKEVLIQEPRKDRGSPSSEQKPPRSPQLQLTRQLLRVQIKHVLS